MIYPSQIIKINKELKQLMTLPDKDLVEFIHAYLLNDRVDISTARHDLYQYRIPYISIDSKYAYQILSSKSKYYLIIY